MNLWPFFFCILQCKFIAADEGKGQPYPCLYCSLKKRTIASTLCIKSHVLEGGQLWGLWDAFLETEEFTSLVAVVGNEKPHDLTGVGE